MNFVVKKQGNSDFTKGLEEAVAAIKKGEGWRWEYMHIKELYDEAREEGIDATLLVISMLDSGETDYNIIAEKANVSQDIVKMIAEKRVKH